MSATEERPDFHHTLDRLKDFQRATARHAFHRLYEAEDSSRRFLVADEVGLGKTLVASGIIARAIEHLWETVPRIDIVYVCSNIDIARQNVNKLNVMGGTGFSRATRLTMLPLEMSGLRGNKVNFVSFTPGTSFDTDGAGQARERALLYKMLRRVWDFGGAAAPVNVLSAYANADRFRLEIEAIDDRKRYPNGIDPDLASAFAKALVKEAEEAKRQSRPSLRARFEELCAIYSRHDRRTKVDENRQRNALVGDLRRILAATGVNALQPDLVVLDEFQRFKDLLDGEGDAAELAQELLTYSDPSSAVRVLLLSATPYRLYATRAEGLEQDHYADFIATLRFLFNDESKAAAVAAKFSEMRRAIYQGSDGRAAVRALRSEIEELLRRVMSRTERLAVSSDRNGMLREVPSRGLALKTTDVAAYCEYQRIARALNQPDLVEFWKAAPFLLNFMDSYKLKQGFVSATADTGLPAAAIFREASRTGVQLGLPDTEIEAQSEIEYPHPRMRWLVTDMLSHNAWRLLWLPPSLPYYELGGPYADPNISRYTKRLVFSAWRVAPKAIATLLSYEAERRMLEATRRPSESRSAQVERTRSLLNFTQSGGRLTGLPVLALVYPSMVLARLADPLVHRSDTSPLLSSDEMLDRIEAALAGPLRELSSEASAGSVEDETWYWAAPILLDLRAHHFPSRQWLRRSDLAFRWLGEEETHDAEEAMGWRQHVERVGDLVRMGKFHRLGRPPADLGRVLAQIALGGPAVCALRALARSKNPARDIEDDEIRDAAGAIGHSFRSLFSLPEVISLVRGMNGAEPYWRRVLEYSIDGGLQSVLDEYVHVLKSWEGVTEMSAAEASSELASRMGQALRLRTARFGVDSFEVAGNGRVVRKPGSMRARFAMRYGDDASEDEKDANRKEAVRAAFNSPFWPFVLASTSVGQEGLDFHLYCHAIVHWNIPPNPVDLEQREGRVHRFKGHAIRKNVAQAFGGELGLSDTSDPWASLFEMAVRRREAGSSDLVPYWVFPMKSGAAIERHVPNLPLSRDAARYATLRRALAVYRMAFGQPRQEDLLEFLLHHPAGGALAAEDLRIDLTPRPT